MVKPILVSDKFPRHRLACRAARAPLTRNRVTAALASAASSRAVRREAR